MKKLPLVEVVWNDAHSDAEKTELASEVGDFHNPAVITSCGYLVRRNKIGLTIAGCYDQFHGEEEREGYERVMFIPAGMVVKVRRLR